MTSVSDYTDLVTSQYSSKPRFVGWLSALVEPIAALSNLLNSMLNDFDLDVAIGAQLDVIGLWVGISRNLPTELLFYFSWDDTVANGWDAGSWKGVGDPDAGITVLGDNLYRNVIRAKILANSWTGNRAGLYEILAKALSSEDASEIIDNQDMSFIIRVDSSKATQLDIAIINTLIVPIKPVGVSLTIQVV